MHLTCPSCSERFPLEAGLADDDGKRLANAFAGMEPPLARAVLRYLRLFKPAKQALRNARAVIMVEALLALVNSGTVCRDERGGMRRPASQAMWAEGIEQMLADSAKLTLPLTNHNYLRAIVYGLADKADAQAERSHEAALRQPARPPDRAGPAFNMALHDALMRIQTDLELGLVQPDEAKQRAADARAQFGGSSHAFAA